MEFFLIKQPTEDDMQNYQPFDDKDFKKSLKVDDLTIVKCETWKQRNIQFHKKYFALLFTVIHLMSEDEKLDRFRNIDSLRKEIMLQNGRFDIHETLGGKIVYDIHSISFKSMDDDKFEEIYNEAINTSLKRFLPEISKKDFENSILNFL